MFVLFINIVSQNGLVLPRFLGGGLIQVLNRIDIVKRYHERCFADSPQKLIFRNGGACLDNDCINVLQRLLYLLLRLHVGFGALTFHGRTKGLTEKCKY